MKTSEGILSIIKALLIAQRKMEAAVKDSKNPYFKSSYADYNSVLAATKPYLNEVGITILQPHKTTELGSFVETILLHESGEFVSSETRLSVAKENDPQALGSAITYARRYGLQSLVSLPAEDDDGEKAMARESNFSKGKAPTSSNVQKTSTAPVVTAPVVTTTAVAPMTSNVTKTTFKKQTAPSNPTTNGSNGNSW